MNNSSKKKFDIEILSVNFIKLKDIETNDIYESGDSVLMDECDYKILFEL